MYTYFTISGLASGRSFCNREKERKKIKYNIETNAATLVISPRRYGKTSLINQTLHEANMVFSHVDLYKALDERDIVNFILSGIAELLKQLAPTPEKLLEAAKEFFSNLQIGTTIHGHQINLSWQQSEKKNVEVLVDALNRLDRYAKKHKQKVALYLDEFQTVYQIMKQDHSIEAGIREAAQKATHVIYMFSGSTRHIIDGIFNDKTRPFYRMCDTIYLKRIGKSDYTKHINKAAKEKWGTPLNNNVINTILILTEDYPYYVNKLCHLLWANLSPPNEQLVKETWLEYAYESKMSIDKQIDELSLNQKRVMIHLSKRPTNEPFGHETAKRWNMNAASIHQSMKVLLEKDYVEKQSDGTYTILDPLIKTVLTSL